MSDEPNNVASPHERLKHLRKLVQDMSNDPTRLQQLRETVARLSEKPERSRKETQELRRAQSLLIYLFDDEGE